MLKRTMDLTIAAAGWVMLSPLLCFISICILFFDGQPVFFRQVRVGRFGQDFVLFKFRTMSEKPGTEKGAFDAGDESRITPLGRLLRKTKLDELPQLWNVLRGDMCLVGPRPEVRKWVNAYPQHWAFVLSVRPGITDPASIVYRNEEASLAAVPDPETYYRDLILPHKLRIYQDYVTNQGISSDLVIILKTILAVIRPRTAAQNTISEQR